MNADLGMLYFGLLLILEVFDSGFAQGKQSCLLFHFFSKPKRKDTVLYCPSFYALRVFTFIFHALNPL